MWIVMALSGFFISCATPVNNRFNDLKNQLQLAYEGESEHLAQHLNLSTTVERVGCPEGNRI